MPDGAPTPTEPTTGERAADIADAGLIRRVRRNLVLWSGGTTLVVLLVLAVALYLAVAGSLARSGTDQLEDAMAVPRAVLSGQRPDPGDTSPYELQLGSPTFAFALDENDHVFAGPRGFRMPAGLPDEDAVAEARASGSDLRTATVGTNEVPVRILTEAVTTRQGQQVVIQVVGDRTTEVQTLQAMLVVLLIGGIVVVLVAFGFGAVYARRALVPIRESLASQRSALRRQRDFAADASHELRTPLTVVRSSVEHLNRHQDEPVREVGSALDDIDAEVRHMTAMVEDLLLLARSDSGAVALDRVPVDLGDVAADGASALAKPASDGGVAIAVDPQPAVVTGDPARLRQLVMILVDNAIRHTPSGGHVAVAVRSDATGATLTVEDDGPGISAEDLPHVFERFYRAPGAPGGGTGLGLAIARWIVERTRRADRRRQSTQRWGRFRRPPAARRRSGQAGRGARPRDQVARQTFGPDQATVVRDGERLVAGMRRDPAQAGEPHHERRGRVGVDEPEAWPDHGHAPQPARRPTGPRIDDVVPALVRPRRRDGTVADGHDRGHLVRLVRVADAHPPAVARGCLAARDHVAAGVDEVVVRPGVIEPPCRLLDRPALDVARWIEASVASGATRRRTRRRCRGAAARRPPGRAGRRGWRPSCRGRRVPAG